MLSLKSKQQRRLIAIWFPTFSTDFYERRDPGLARHPFATYRQTHNAILLIGVNQAACHEGLTPGMTLANARALLPSIALREEAGEAALAHLHKLRDWCLRYTPLVAVDPYALPLNTGYEQPILLLDITGCAHLFGGEASMAQDLVERLDNLGFSIRLGVADTPLAAMALAQFGEQPITYQRENLRDALRAFPLQALRISAKVIEDLHRVGLKCLGDVFPLPRASLAARYGFDFAQRLDRALGDLEDPISPTPFAPPYRVRLNFPDPIGMPEDIAQAVSRLITRLTKRLERDCKGCRRLVLHCFRADGDVQHVTVGAAHAARDPKHLARLFSERLSHLDPGFGIDAMVLAAEQLEPLYPAQEATHLATTEGVHDRGHDGGHEKQAVLCLADRLAAKLGTDQVLSFVSVDSHIPEYAHILRPFHDQRYQQQSTAYAKPFNGAGRPSRLLSPPEPIEALDFSERIPLSLFRWRGRQRRVLNMVGPERIEPPWWQRQPNLPSYGTRDYYHVEDQEGHRFWLYREAGRKKRHNHKAAAYKHGWHMHGIFL